MRTCKHEQSETEILSPHAELALIGYYLSRQTTLGKTSCAIFRRQGIKKKVSYAYVGLVCLGKSNVESVG